MIPEKLAVFVVGSFAVVGLVTGAIHEHDKRVLAEVAAQQSALVAADAQAQADRTIAGMQTALNVARTRADNLATIRSEINAQPHTTTCAGSPAVRAAVVRLRHPAGRDAGAASTDSGAAVGVPAATGTAR